MPMFGASFRIVSSFLIALLIAAPCAHLRAQSNSDEIAELKRVVNNLALRVSALEQQNAELRQARAATGSSGPEAAAAMVRATYVLRGGRAANDPAPQTVPVQAVEQAPPPVAPLTLPGGATLNFLFDGYYEYNFNNPPGRANDLRAYDVLSNVFSINQADLIFALDPDIAARRRYGARIDLQFGQATETLQGNPSSEPRPEIYRNIFQAYGSYVAPIGNGLNIDLGKWASSLGVEGNYVKDQMNYTRSYYYYFLPFYHSGARANYHVNSKLAANYWVVNGTNQSEPTNGFKDELFGFVFQPARSLTWTANYYLGQEHPDSVASTACPVPIQPGLCMTRLSPAPDGKLHIVDSYATWAAAPKLTLQGEADYVIQREWVNAAAGRSSAPEHVIGGVGYAQYQFVPRINLAARTEYLSDRGGLFSGTTQALKEATATYQYKVSDWFDAFFEYRRDWSNRPYFQTTNGPHAANHQDTAAVGLVWWYGGKQGAW